MKRFPLFFIFMLAWSVLGQAQPAGAPSVSTHQPAPGAAANPVVITADEWQQLRAARAAAIKANPDLLTENTKLMEKIRALEEKINAAMVKTDPAIAPLLDKFKAGREPAPAGPHANSPSLPSAQAGSAHVGK